MLAAHSAVPKHLEAFLLSSLRLVVTSALSFNLYLLTFVAVSSLLLCQCSKKPPIIILPGFSNDAVDCENLLN